VLCDNLNIDLDDGMRPWRVLIGHGGAWTSFSEADINQVVNLILVVDLNLDGVGERGVALWVLNDVEHFAFGVEEVSYVLVVDLDETEPEVDFGFGIGLELFLFVEKVV
jgi:hypothetical protein